MIRKETKSKSKVGISERLQRDDNRRGILKKSQFRYDTLSTSPLSSEGYELLYFGDPLPIEFLLRES